MLKIDEKYFINTNSKSFILLLDTGRQNSVNGIEKEVFKVIGYYTTLEQALNGYCDQNLKNYISDHDINLSAVLEKIENLKIEMSKFEIPFENRNAQKILEVEELDESDDASLVDNQDNQIDELEYEKSSN